MALVLQNDSGTITTANAYIDAAFFKSHHKDRGNDTSSFSTGDIEAGIVRATDYLDERFRFVGDRLGVNQTTKWPRINAEDADGFHRFGIPLEIKQATAEYAFVAQSTLLNPTPDRDSTGRSVTAKKEKVGPLEESVTYTSSGTFELPRYPVADNKLFSSGLVVDETDIRRG